MMARESRVAVAAFVAMVAGMVATPLFERAGEGRRLLATVVVGSLFVCALAAAVHAHGRRAAAAAAMIVVVTYLVEVLGSGTGFPFGSYDYGTALSPRLFGVPIIVSFAWAGITLVVHGMFPARPGRPAAGVIARIATMAGAITAWDAFLDPQMVAEGYWTWEPTRFAYRGIPLVNYLGWLLTAAVASSIAVVVCRSGSSASGVPDQRLPRFAYATIAALSTVGFLFFFDDPVVALVGAAAMGSFSVASFLLARGRPG